MKQKGALVKNSSKNEKVQKVKQAKVPNKQPIKVDPTPKKGVALKKPSKKAAKVPPPKAVIEDEDDDEEEEDSGADVQNFGHDEDSADDSEEISAENNAVESEEDDSGDEADIGAEVDSEDDDEDDDDEEENNINEKSAAVEEDEDSDDEEPAEEPIVKKKNKDESKQSKGIPKIKFGPIPEDTTDDQVIVVKNLPLKCKELDFVKIFAKYGTMEAISTSKLGNRSIAFIAFSAADEAEAALEANKSKFKSSIIEVELKKPTFKKIKNTDKQEQNDLRAEKIKEYENCKDRTVYVKKLNKNTTKEQLESHFQQCGKIENITLKTFSAFPYAFITYSDRTEAIESLKLNKTKLNGVFISVYMKDGKDAPLPENRTILLVNKNDLPTIKEEKIKSIFAKCGEIEVIQVRATKKVLAFIVFKNENSVKKALKLNGTTVNDIEIELEEFKKIEHKNTQVFVNNIGKNVTEEDIREFFSVSGEVVNIIQKPGFAIVKFKDQEGFCKSFLQNEAKLKNQMIFLEPYSIKKPLIVKAGKKRSMPPHQTHFAKKLKTQN